jgi:anti-sigma factor RsiW
MNCETAKNLIQAYLEGRLPRLERNEFVYHVTECGGCETEVLEYRQVFRALRSLERFEAPSRIQVGVLAHLRAEGKVHEPSFPLLRRLVDAFLGLPARVRYPVSALVAVVVMYLPVGFILAGTRGSLAGIAEALGRGVLWVQDLLGGIAVKEDVEPYARTARTVGHAAAEVVSPVAVLLLAVAVFTIVGYVSARFLRRRRSSSHAMFSL